MVIGVTVLTAGLFGMIAVAYANTPVPTVQQAEALAQGSVLYYSDGKTKIAHLGTKRTIITIDKVPEHVQDAVIAIENNSFREDSGISISAMVRSVYMTATGQQLQGASTITQQMARNYYDGLSQEVSIKRKVKEIFVAVKINKEMDKNEILINYLNTINFGRAYGIEAASQAYFGKSASKLNEAEGAYLAARIQTPSWEANAPELKSRFTDVVNAMANYNAEKYGKLPATAKFPKTKPDKDVDELGGLKGYMVMQVLEELKTRGMTPDMVRSGGYKIVSTFDRRLMLAAKKAVTNVTANMSKEFHTGLAAVNPKNGRVIAFYGGNDYVTDPWNEPWDSKKQAASAFKPYVLAAWLESGFSLNSFVPGNKTFPTDPLEGTTPITNSHKEKDAIDVVRATSASINTAYASMAYAVPGQLDTVKAIAVDAGLDEKRMTDDVAEHKYLFSIGTAPVTAVEQAAGYSIFANAGKHVDAHTVIEVSVVKDGKRSVVLGEKKPVKQVISPEAAADSIVALKAVITGGTASGNGNIGRPAGGKTGTNTGEEDAWFVGFTPQLSTAVGMYREQCKTKSGKIVQPRHSNCPKKTFPVEIGLGFQGADAPTRIWRDFMIEAHRNWAVQDFPPRAGTGAPENIVPSPSPTPTPEVEGDFPPDFPDDGAECFPGGEGCDVDIPEDDGSVDPFTAPAAPATAPLPVPTAANRRE
ncbi:transglycosylase domain-containing protein [Acrocarpospora pleiomorpha]|uniref:transglycosylase domain-containing protein n=1 Tax=Acrocarpospora pleiomorpha TaxID=90975 RepID=UPI0012D2E3FF|nr:transglycosylase domain-containing protein [Acrocarpospora pleiomorpha]